MPQLTLRAVTFLPIAARELRVASRKRSTFWLRVVAAVVGLVIGAACMLIATLGQMATPGFGSALFGILTWLALGAALTAGVFFTSDCLSEEKREGTLGFLFLTDLRGYDVISGKLLATSLRGLFALLALFPILAITLLMGGVAGVEFWKTTLALLNALFCSLAAGLFISAISHDSQKAMAGTFLLLLLFVATGPIADGIYAQAQGVGFVPRASLTSPGYLFTIASGWTGLPFWWTLLVTQAIAWLFFGVASLLIARTWQQKAATRVTRGWVYAWKYGGAKRRLNIRRKLLDRDAIVWLACRERWQSIGIWIITLLGVGGFVAVLVGLPREVWTGWRFLSALFLFAFYLWAASQSCRFFIEARKSGLRELLLSAPLSEGQIVRGHWRALRRMYGGPVILLLSLNLAGTALSQYSWTRLTAGTAAPTPTTTVTTNVSGTNVVTTTTTVGTGSFVVSTTTGTNTVTQRFITSISQNLQLTMAVLSSIASGLTTAGNLIALCWFGMWMGLTSRNANFATLKTLAFVQIVPAMVIWFASTIGITLVLMPIFWKSASATGASSTFYMYLWPVLSTAAVCVLSLAKDIGFILWSRRRLYGSFREVASRSFNQPRVKTQSPATTVSPPPVAPPPPPPPVVPTPPLLPAPS